MAKITIPNRILLRFILAYLAMLLAYTASTAVISEAGAGMTAEESSRAAGALLVVALVNAIVLSYLILRTPWRGWKLIDAVFFIHFGTETFMAQLETLYYNRSVMMGAETFWGIVTAGVLRALIFAPLGVLIFGKFRGEGAQIKWHLRINTRFIRRIFAVALVYVVIYYLFGYFVAWQWEETRVFYTGSEAIKPFFSHFRDQFFRDDPFSLPFQLLRGMLWALLTALIIRSIRTGRLESSLATGITFAVFLALPLGVFPNPYLPAIVARSHFIEISTSMLLFGGIAGWLLTDTQPGPGG